MERTPRRRMDPQYRAVKTTNGQEDGSPFGDPSIPGRPSTPHPHTTPGALSCRRKAHLRLARSGDRAPSGLLSSRRSSAHSTRSLAALKPPVVGAAVLRCCCAAVLLCCCAAVLLCCCAAVLSVWKDGNQSSRASLAGVSAVFPTTSGRDEVLSVRLCVRQRVCGVGMEMRPIGESAIPPIWSI